MLKFFLGGPALLVVGGIALASLPEAGWGVVVVGVAALVTLAIGAFLLVAGTCVALGADPKLPPISRAPSAQRRNR